MANLDIDKRLKEVDNIFHDVYEEEFEYHFSGIENLYKQAQTSKGLTDKELEMVLTELPLELYQVSEKLAQLKLKLEITNIEISKAKADLELEIEAQVDKTRSDLSKTDKSALIRKTLLANSADWSILPKVYQAIIDRVQNQITFCKEFIMACKKIWDARRDTDKVLPVSETVVEDLPEYGKTYIK